MAQGDEGCALTSQKDMRDGASRPRELRLARAVSFWESSSSKLQEPEEDMTGLLVLAQRGEMEPCIPGDEG